MPAPAEITAEVVVDLVDRLAGIAALCRWHAPAEGLPVDIHMALDLAGSRSLEAAAVLAVLANGKLAPVPAQPVPT
jgi:hypothetical protein